MEANNSLKLLSKKSSETSSNEEQILKQQIKEAETQKKLMEAQLKLTKEKYGDLE